MATEQKKRGRPLGVRQPHLERFPGILKEMRLAWNRMRAQAKYRNETWDIPWEMFLELWEGKWHMRGTCKGSYALNRIDWDSAWSVSNVTISLRDEHWSRQRRAQLGKRYR